MNKKRFSLTNPISHNPIPSWVDIIHDDKEHKHLGAEEIVELLNTLHQENQDLKFQLDVCANNKLYSRRKLEEENEKLKEQNRKLYKLALNCKTIGDSDE